MVLYKVFMVRRNKKKPKKNKDINVSTSKEPKGQPSTSDKNHIRWCFEFFDNKHWHDDTYSHESFYNIAKKLRSYQGLTWGDIKKKDHPVKISDIIKEAQDELIHLKQDDADQLWRLELTGLQRLWGIRFQDIFRVLWWDPQHKICPSFKKHT